MTGKAKGTVFVLLCVGLWALIPVVAKLGQTTLDNHQFLFWSSLVSFGILTVNAALFGKLREVKKYSPVDWVSISVLGLLGTYIYYLFLYLGYAQAKGIEVLVVQYSWPIFVAGLSIWILNEKLTPRKVIAMVLGFSGVITVLTRGDISQVNVSNPTVISLVAAGAFCFALFSVLSKKIKKDPIVVVSLYFLSALVASFFSMFFFSSFSIPTTTEIWPILLNGLLVNGYSYIFWMKALQATEASYLAPFIFITPILSAVYLVIFFDEPMVIAYVVGLVLIISGGLINSLHTRVEPGKIT